MTMVDLCSGRGGASAAMVERGWNVYRVELDGRLSCQIDLLGRPADVHVGDVTAWSWRGGAVDLLWASPPCTEFARESMPWCKTGRDPSLGIVRAVIAQVEAIRPRWWCLENVRGAIKWFRPELGEPIVRASPLFLWGKLPPVVIRSRPRKEAISGTRPDLRSLIPFDVSLAVARAVELAS